MLPVRKPVLTTMMVLVFIVLGAVSFMRIKVDLFPEISFPYVTVVTIYPGAGPGEVETQLTEKIEDEVVAISRVKRVMSTSRENVSVVAIEFELGTDVDLASIEVKDKVDAIRFSLPQSAEDPSVTKFDIGAAPVMDLSLSGSLPLEDLYELADTKLKDAFSRVDGVSSIAIVGGKEREIQVNLDSRALNSYGLSPMEVYQTVAMSNLSVPAGRVVEGPTEYSVRMLGEFGSLAELEAIRIPTMTGGSVRLTDVATVVDGFKDQRSLARLDGNPSVGITIQKRSDANVIETVDGIAKAIDRLADVLPSGVDIAVVRDSSTFIRSAVRDVIISIILGIVLTSAVLYLFLHDLRSTVIVAIVMPASIVATFLLIDFAGFTLNLMSLLGLGISIGTLVANAIVVLESISSQIDRGESPRSGTEIGVRQVMVAVIASATTNVVVFAPIGFMSGIVGQFFKQFGLTVVFATLFSLFVSFTLTPLLASRLLRSSAPVPSHGPLSALFRLWDRAYGALQESYGRTLVWSLKHRLLTIVMATALFVGGIYLFKFIGSDFLPQFYSDTITIGIQLPPGASLDATDQRVSQIEAIARKLPETVSVASSLGRGSSGQEGVEFASTMLILDPDRKRRGGVIVGELRSLLITEVPDVDLSFDTSQGGGDSGMDVSIEVRGQDLDELTALAESVKALVDATPNLVDSRMSHRSGKPELAVQLDRDRLDRFHLSLAQVGGLLRTSLTGEVASVYREGGEEYDIRVRLDESDREQLEDVDRLLVRVGETSVPLVDLGEVSFRRGPAELTHTDKQRTIAVEANIASGDLGSTIAALRAQTNGMRLPDGYSIHYTGQAEMQQESFASIVTALILAIILTYMLLAALLESFVHPFTIMLTLPLGLAGASAALLISRLSINIFSLMAIVMLVGIVVNNGILLLDLTRQFRVQGMAMRDALIAACPLRLRAILMSNVAIVAGMLPQALSTGGVAAVQSAMAVVMIGGVTVSMVFTLYVIPVAYTIVDRVARAPEVETGSA
ncbi:efflux RND transporter permease subunit [Candidatus Poribacteria bacterium]|nr:efflux RND transporter permease subunit [Candidatus Poribacteria bacterium]